MDDELRRKHDVENLNKIPVIENKIDTLTTTVIKIVSKLEDYNGVKSDINWVKRLLFWWGGVISGIILIIVGILLKR